KKPRTEAPFRRIEAEGVVLDPNERLEAFLFLAVGEILARCREPERAGHFAAVRLDEIAAEAGTHQGAQVEAERVVLLEAPEAGPELAISEEIPDFGSQRRGAR